MKTEKFLAKSGEKIILSKFPTHDTQGISKKSEAKKMLKDNIKKMQELQNRLYASDKYALLLIFQAMDAAGKDSTIKHVMSGLNPQGTQVFSFKKPSDEELDHGYLWRISKSLPERGRIGIFNRSHYEEVLVVRIHDLIKYQRLPEELITKDIWQKRFEQINNFENYLHNNGTITLKFFLHVSKDEQKNRFLARIDDQSKNWKFSEDDLKERSYWKDYQKLYQEAISATSKEHAPWYIIPADKKWFMRLLVSEIIVKKLESLNLKYPELNKEQLEGLEKCKTLLQNEKSILATMKSLMT
jgi:PPK2 family polyphosphate:nucleotide phosphotransferase